MDCKWKGCTEENNTDLFTHIKEHLKEQTIYKCMWIGCSKYDEVCGTKGALHSHCKAHAGIKNYACTICDIEFTSISVYYRHKKKHSNFEKKEEVSIQKISVLSDLLIFHKNRTQDLLTKINQKTTIIKFLNNEIVEIIKKYLKESNCYSNVKSWREYL